MELILKSYLDKETDARESTKPLVYRKKSRARLIGVALVGLLTVGAASLILLTQPTVQMKHDEEAIASSIEVSALLPNGDELYTKSMQDGQYFDAVQAGSRLIDQHPDHLRY